MLDNTEDNNVQLLKEVEKISFRDRKYITPFDALLTAAILFPEKCIKTKGEYHATVELQGNHTRGQMVLDHRNSKCNVTVIECLDQEEFEKIIEWTVAA